VAKVTMKMPEDFLLKVSRLNDKTDEIVPRVLKAGGEVVLDKVKSNLNSAIGSDTKYPSRSTGELAAALGLSSALQDRDGNHNVKVGFSEPRRDGSSNAKQQCEDSQYHRIRKIGSTGKTILKASENHQ